MKRRIAIFGSTGSIGTQTLDVIRQHRDLFEVELISARSSTDLLIRQAIEFDAAHVVICDETRYQEVADALQPRGTKVWAGVDSLCDLAGMDSVDIVVGAMVGFSGLRPTLAALRAGKVVALANKETLVAAGSVVTRTAREHGGVILPVDSEHSAIFQCLLAAGENPVERVHLTASGGPFRTWDRQRIAGATAAQALRHPNWDMGAKVTIDSATMMNKGFEVIEAKWLFDLRPEQINVVVHPESVIHSMVEFVDGAVIAQLGCPDMREPIGFALSFPSRLTVGNKKLDFAALGSLSFEAPDTNSWPCRNTPSAYCSGRCRPRRRRRRRCLPQARHGSPARTRGSRVPPAPRGRPAVPEGNSRPCRPSSCRNPLRWSSCATKGASR